MVKKLKCNKTKGRPRRAGYDLVMATKDAGKAKRHATQLLDQYPDKYVTFDFGEDNNGYILVYMLKQYRW